MNKLVLVSLIGLTSCTSALEKKLQRARNCHSEFGTNTITKIVKTIKMDSFPNYIFLACDSANQTPVVVDSSLYKVSLDSSKVSIPKVAKVPCNCVNKTITKEIYVADPYLLYLKDIAIDSVQDLLTKERISKVKEVEKVIKSGDKSKKWTSIWIIVAGILFLFNIVQIYINRK